MRVALFSDVHGNITGLRAVLAYLQRLGGADVLFAAGDLVGGGPGAEDLLDILLERGVRMVRGDSEEIHLNPEPYLEHVPEAQHPFVFQTSAWLHERLSQPYRDLLASLPLYEKLELAPDRTLLVCHATPQSPWAQVCAADTPAAALRAAYGPLVAEVVAYGHHHRHHVLWFDSKLLLNVASVGLRTDGLSAFTILEHDAERWIARQYLVPYDVAEERHLTIERDVPQSNAAAAARPAERAPAQA